MALIDVNNTQIHYRLDGPEQGPVIMFSNSLASNLSMWDNQISELTAAGYRILRYDSRGHGQSAVPQGPYSIEMLCNDAVGLLDQLGLDKVFFCGLSKGGMVGQMFGVKYPERLTALMLSSTSAYVGFPESWNERIDQVQSRGMQSVVEATIDRWFTQSGQERMPKEVGKIRKMILDTPVEGFCASCAAIRDMDQRKSITAISLPTLIVVGEHDQGTPVEETEFIHRQINSSQLQIIPEAAHMVNIEQANVFTRVLLEFVNYTIA